MASRASHFLNLLNSLYGFHFTVQLNLTIPESRGWSRWAGSIRGGGADGRGQLEGVEQMGGMCGCLKRVLCCGLCHPCSVWSRLTP